MTIVFKKTNKAKNTAEEVYVNVDGMYAAGRAKDIYDEFHAKNAIGFYRNVKEMVEATFKSLNIPFTWTADNALIYEV